MTFRVSTWGVIVREHIIPSIIETVGQICIIITFSGKWGKSNTNSRLLIMLLATKFTFCSIR